MHEDVGAAVAGGETPRRSLTSSMAQGGQPVGGAHRRTVTGQSSVIDPRRVWTTAWNVSGIPTAAAGDLSLSCQRPFVTG